MVLVSAFVGIIVTSMQSASTMVRQRLASEELGQAHPEGPGVDGMAEGLAAAGANLAIWGRKDADNKAAAEKLAGIGAGDAKAWSVDVADEQAEFVELREKFEALQAKYYKDVGKEQQRAARACRPDVVWFGEMPYRVEDVFRQVGNATVFLSSGTSGVVYPAAGFPQVAKMSGARLIIINNEPTDLDPLFDLVLHQQIGPTLSAVVNL